MADFVFNVAKGRVVELFNRVDQNDPTNAVIVVVPINTTATDATLKDLDTLSAYLADGNTSEATGSNWARKVLDQDDISTISPDDTNDRFEVDIADQTWSAVAASNDVTDLVIAYDNDSTGGTDANIIPLVQLDFSVTTDGSDITAQFNTDGLFRAS